MININTQSRDVPRQIAGTYNPSIEMLREYGWREEPELPPVADGYERSAITYAEGDGITAQAVYEDTLIADRLASERAAKLATFPAQSAAIFRVLLRRHFGQDAETNREITAQVVEAYFADLTVRQVITAQQASDGVFLSQLFAELAAWNGTGETWTLFERYGQEWLPEVGP